MQFTAIQCTTVDGVPVFWAPVDTWPHRVELVFRVGMADEPLPMRGASHLVEHLALFPFGLPAFSFNGVVSATATSFHAEGTWDEVCAFARDVTRSLQDLPYDRLEAEKQIIEVESAGTTVGPASWMSHLRFGSIAYGRRVKKQIGLHALDPEKLEAWRREWFTRGNLVIWMTGEPPSSLGLDLPDGERKPLPEADPLPALELPAVSWSGSDNLSLSLVGAESDAFRTAITAVERRLYEELRRRRGIVYDVDVVWSGVGRARDQAVFSIDCSDAHAGEVFDELARTLSDVAEHGPTDDELEAERERVRRVLRDPLYVLEELDEASFDYLCGIEPTPYPEWFAGLEQLTSEQCAEALRTALPTMLAELPDELYGRPPDGFSAYEATPPPQPKPEGPVFREKDETDCPARPCEYVVADDRLHLQPGDGGEPSTIPYEDVTAVKGHAGATWRLITRDDRRFEISAFAYRDAEEFLAMLRDKIPAELWIPQDEAAQAVDTAAVRDLAQPELLTAELDDLATTMAPGEQPLVLTTDALAGDDMKPALVAVTDRRFVFVYRDPEEDRRDTWNTAPLERMGGIEADEDDEGRPRLTFTVDGEESQVSGIESREAARRVVDALTRAREARQGAA